MQKNLQDYIDSNLPFLKETKLLIAISGGLDSLVLTHLCYKLNLNIALAHCNFNLRGDESDADEDFVLQLAEDLDLEVFIESFETEVYASAHKLSTQMAARELRYDWFEDLAETLDFDYILTAHHADDNLETFLINLSRGTGLDGLMGIPEINNNIVRPLLSFSRVSIEAYAREHNLKWREDSSNASNKYLRNKFRHDVIPILKTINPQLLQNFETTQNHLQDSKCIIEDAIAKIQKKVVSVEGDVVKLNIKKLKKLSNPKAYVYQLLKDFNFTEWNAVVDLLDAQSGKQLFSSTHRLIKDREFLLLSEIHSEDIPKVIINKKSTEAQGLLCFDEVDNVTEASKTVIFVDKDKLKFPLELRQWEEGDVFYPLGMKGKKKLSKYFKDEKLSLIDKENVRLLCSDGTIVWIVGKRADERFKVTASTKQILKIELSVTSSVVEKQKKN
jgi:tRNA(Ile)-lysidine synthase